MKSNYITIGLLLVLLTTSSLGVTNAQEGTTAYCGSIIEGEFVEWHEEHRYFIDLEPGDVLSVSGESVGEYLRYFIHIYTPDGTKIADTLSSSNTPSIRTNSLSARGTYSILLTSDAAGVYIMYIACVLRDGTVINPGDQTPEVIEEPVFSGYGFPGLVPVDFSEVATLPLSIETPMGGAITPTGGEILGFTFNANANDVVQLSYNRASGNLNLGLVVFSADNTVVFQASLVTSDMLTTQFSLPKAGEYIIGIFPIDLLPPENPQPTSFQLQVVLQ